VIDDFGDQGFEADPMQRVVLVIDFGVHADAGAKDRAAILPVCARIYSAALRAEDCLTAAWLRGGGRKGPERPLQIF
jgi:hypothetical protein